MAGVFSEAQLMHHIVAAAAEERLSTAVTLSFEPEDRPSASRSLSLPRSSMARSPDLPRHRRIIVIIMIIIITPTRPSSSPLRGLYSIS